MIICPNTGRKPWFCHCPDCDADRLAILPDVPVRPNLAAGFLAVPPINVFSRSPIDLGDLVRDVLIKRAPMPAWPPETEFIIQVRTPSYVDGARRAYPPQLGEDLSVWCTPDHKFYGIKSGPRITYLSATSMDKMANEGRREKNLDIPTEELWAHELERLKDKNCHPVYNSDILAVARLYVGHDHPVVVLDPVRDLFFMFGLGAMCQPTQNVLQLVALAVVHSGLEPAVPVGQEVYSMLRNSWCKVPRPSVRGWWLDGVLYAGWLNLALLRHSSAGWQELFPLPVDTPSGLTAAVAAAQPAG